MLAGWRSIIRVCWFRPSKPGVNWPSASTRIIATPTSASPSTGKLLNDLIPEQKLEYSQVNDTVVGRSVQGESLMATEVGVQMPPDPRRAILTLVVLARSRP